MIKYLICESKARAMGISREVYVAFVESQGYTYSNNTHSDDSYGFIEKTAIVDGEIIGLGIYALVVDDTAPYYTNLPETPFKSQLKSAEEMVTDGWDIPIVS